jgi:CubicO group peptidase (beta-lactamase class C family)
VNGRVGAPTGRAPATGRRVLVIVMCVLPALVAGLLWRPAPGPLPSGHFGDAELAELARDVVGPDRPALAVAAVTAQDVRSAVIGAGLQDRFEIGSISKGLTGLLFADMIGRGEVTPETRVGALLPLDPPLADVSLAQLATHHSGLTPQPETMGQFLRNYWGSLAAANPYDATLAERLTSLEGAELTAPPATYSNTGFELLGAALAAAAGTPYPQLLAERVLGPLGMQDTIVPVSEAGLGPPDLIGETGGGRRADPWLGEAAAPAGAVRADVTDMAVLARALLTGEAPGNDALAPRLPFDEEDRIGWAWFTRTDPETGHEVVWHNGGTGGFTAFIGIDRQAGVGVAVLSAVGESPNHVTRAGFRLLARIGGDA